MSFSNSRRPIREGPRRRSPARRRTPTKDVRRTPAKGSSSAAAAPSAPSAPSAAAAAPAAAHLNHHRFGALKPTITLRGPMALARERSDHVRADLEARAEQIAALRSLNADLVAKNAAKDHLLNRQRDTCERAKAHNAALRVQVADASSDLLAANAHAQSLSRVHEDALEDHARARYEWDEERQRHDAAENAAREVLAQLAEAREEIVRMQALYDALEGERDDLSGVVKKLSHEVSVLRHVRAQKDKHVALLAKEKDRLERTLLQQRKKTSRRITTRGALARAGEQRRRRTQLEQADLDVLIGAATADCTEGTSSLVSSSGSTGSGQARGSTEKLEVVSTNDGDAQRHKNRIRASATMALRDKLAVLAQQIRVEKERNTRLESDIAKSRKTNQSLRTRLRNSRPASTPTKSKAEESRVVSEAVASGAQDRPRFLSP